MLICVPLISKFAYLSFRRLTTGRREFVTQVAPHYDAFHLRKHADQKPLRVSFSPFSLLSTFRARSRRFGAAKENEWKDSRRARIFLTHFALISLLKLSRRFGKNWQYGSELKDSFVIFLFGLLAVLSLLLFPQLRSLLLLPRRRCYLCTRVYSTVVAVVLFAAHLHNSFLFAFPLPFVARRRNNVANLRVFIRFQHEIKLCPYLSSKLHFVCFPMRVNFTSILFRQIRRQLLNLWYKLLHSAKYKNTNLGKMEKKKRKFVFMTCIKKRDVYETYFFIKTFLCSMY